MTLIVSLWIAGLWLRKININIKEVSKPSEIDFLIDSSMEGIAKWLQVLRPRPIINKIIPYERRDLVMSHISYRFMTSYMLALVLFSVIMLYMIVFDVIGSGGFFGAMLKTRIGKGVGIGFMLYIYMSTLSLFIFGVIAFINLWRMK